ncbi:MAG: hypothetical protein CM1200mP1_14710 [Candidatus Neomarinimicrobiota bacterium]|nr:MAG: hypothetical protein CM1200mP1_14710 [Candidatus Neomarinimicrobiota bacterium]
MHKSIFDSRITLLSLKTRNKITLHNNYENIKNIVVAEWVVAIGGDLVKLLIKNKFKKFLL